MLIDSAKDRDVVSSLAYELMERALGKSRPPWFGEPCGAEGVEAAPACPVVTFFPNHLRDPWGKPHALCVWRQSELDIPGYQSLFPGSILSCAGAQSDFSGLTFMRIQVYLSSGDDPIQAAPHMSRVNCRTCPCSSPHLCSLYPRQHAALRGWKGGA